MSGRERPDSVYLARPRPFSGAGDSGVRNPVPRNPTYPLNPLNPGESRVNLTRNSHQCHGLRGAVRPTGQERRAARCGASGKRRDELCRPDSAALRVAPRRPPAASRASTVFPELMLFAPGQPNMKLLRSRIETPRRRSKWCVPRAARDQKSTHLRMAPADLGAATILTPASCRSPSFRPLRRLQRTLAQPCRPRNPTRCPGLVEIDPSGPKNPTGGQGRSPGKKIRVGDGKFAAGRNLRRRILRRARPAGPATLRQRRSAQ